MAVNKAAQRPPPPPPSTSKSTAPKPTASSSPAGRSLPAAPPKPPSTRSVASGAHRTSPPKPSPGQAEAQAAVTVHTVADDRRSVEDQGNKIRTDATHRVDQAFALANKKPADLPKDVSVARHGNTVELTRRDKQGDVLERTTATRNGDSVSFDQTTYGKNGRATSDRLAADKNTSSAAQVQWSASPSKTPTPPPSTSELQNSGSPDVQVQETSVQRNGSETVASQYSQGPHGVTQSTTTYGQQTGTGGVYGKLAGKFHNGPIDTAKTDTVTLPPAGTLGSDGKPVKPSLTHTESYSQDGVRATFQQPSTVKMDAPQHPNAQDAAHALDKSTDKQTSPKQWKLELSHGNQYASQTFLEGNSDATVVTHREAKGNTLTETSQGKAFGQDGKLHDVSSSSQQTFANDGSITQLHSDTRQADGSHQVQDYHRTDHNTSKGLDIHEQLQTRLTTSDGKTYSSDKTTETRLGKEGIQLLSSDETLTGPNGASARTRIDGHSEQTFVNGAPVKGKDILNRSPPDARQLAAQSVADTFHDVQNFARKGGANALSLLDFGKQQVSGVPGDLGHRVQNVNNNLNDRIKQYAAEHGVTSEQLDAAYRIQSGAVGGAKGVAGLAGVVSSGIGLFDGIRDQNIPQIIGGAVGVGTSGKAAFTGAKELYNAARGKTEPFVPGSVKAANLGTKVDGWLSKVPGVSEDLASRGGTLAEGASGLLGRAGGVANVAGGVLSGIQLINGIANGNAESALKGGVGVAGAVGAYVAVGAVAGSEVPLLGTAIGAGVGLLTFGAQELIGSLFGDGGGKHKIAHVQI